MKKYFILLLSCFTSLLHAQEFSTRYYGKTQGAEILANNILALPDGGVLLPGADNLADTGGYRIHAIRTNKTGNVVWERSYQQGSANWAAAAPDGGFVLSGSALKYDFGPDKAFVLKIDNTGASQWIQYFDYGSESTIKHLLPMPDGGYALCGNIQNYDSTRLDAFWAILDQDGHVQHIEIKQTPSDESAQSLLVTRSGDIVVQYYGLSGNSSGFSQLVCYQPNGNEKWQINLEDDGYRGLSLEMLQGKGNTFWIASGYGPDPNSPLPGFTTPEILLLSLEDGQLLQRQLSSYISYYSSFRSQHLLLDAAQNLYFITGSSIYGALFRQKINPQGLTIARDTLPGGLPLGLLALRSPDSLFVLRSPSSFNQLTLVHPHVVENDSLKAEPNWQFGSSRPYSHEFFRKAVRSSDGNWLVLGMNEDSDPFLIDGLLGYFVMKTDQTGNVLAQFQLQNDNVYAGVKMAPDDSGGVFIQYNDGKVVHLDHQLKLLWEKPLSKVLLIPGVSGSFIILQETSNNNYYISTYTADGRKSHEHSFLINQSNTRIFSGLGNYNGGYTLFGRYDDGAKTFDWMVYLDEDGKFKGSTFLPDAEGNFGSTHQLERTPDGGIVVAGSIVGQGNKIRVSKIVAGELIWDHYLNSTLDEASGITIESIEALPCGGYVVAARAYTSQVPPPFNAIILLEYLNENGQTQGFYSFHSQPVLDGPEGSFIPGYTYHYWGYELHEQTYDIFLKTVHFPDTLHHPVQVGEFSISPNPSAREICLEYTHFYTGPIDVEVFNAAGQRIDFFTTFKSDPTWHQLYYSSQPEGVYFIRITTKTGERLVAKWSKGM